MLLSLRVVDGPGNGFGSVELAILDGPDEDVPFLLGEVEDFVRLGVLDRGRTVIFLLDGHAPPDVALALLRLLEAEVDVGLVFRLVCSLRGIDRFGHFNAPKGGLKRRATCTKHQTFLTISFNATVYNIVNCSQIR